MNGKEHVAAMDPGHRAMLQEVANQVLHDRLNRANVIGATKSGRTKIEWVGEPTPAEVFWNEKIMVKKDLTDEH